MYKGTTIAVVIPAYNEEGLVGRVIDTVPGFVDHVYVIDDASTDGTWDEIQRHAARINRSQDESARVAGESGHSQPVQRDGTDPELLQSDGGQLLHPRVVPIRHETNRGVGAAIKTGYRRVLQHGIDVAAVMNGDGQMDPRILDRILDPVVEGNAEYAKGNRLPNPGNMPLWRVFGNIILTLLTKVASGYWDLLDSQNGYTAISRQALDRLDIDEAAEAYGFLNDMLIRMNAQDMRVTDVPMQGRYGEETSDIRLASFIPTVSVLLVSMFLWRVTEKHLVTSFPAIMYPVGIVEMAAGTAGLVYYLWSLLAGGAAPVSALAPLFVFGLGCLTVVLALLVELRRANRGIPTDVRSHG